METSIILTVALAAAIIVVVLVLVGIIIWIQRSHNKELQEKS